MTQVVRKSRLGAVIRATSGNFLEQFDFFLFGFYAIPISKAFFPSADETASLMLAFGTFWLGALMRPVGALVLGPYLDRVGRRKGLIVTLSIMAVGTVLIAVTPTYAVIGLMAPVIVLSGRLLQGLSTGVEVGGVSVYLAEISTPGHRGFLTSFQSASQQVAIFAAALIGFGLNAAMPAQAIGEWGWRVPFLIGCLIIPFVLVIRRSLEETPAFLAQKHHPSTGEVFRSMAANWKIVVLGMMLASMTTVTFYFITVYTPTFGKSVLKLTDSESLMVTLFVAASNFVWVPIGGAISDRVGRKPMLLGASLLALVIAYPALSWLVVAPTFGKMLAVELCLSVLFGLYNGAMVAALTEVVPAQERATGFSLSFSLAAGLFGTFTPLVATALIRATGDRASPGYWLMCAAAAGAVSTLLIYRRARTAEASV